MIVLDQKSLSAFEDSHTRSDAWIATSQASNRVSAAVRSLRTSLSEVSGGQGVPQVAERAREVVRSCWLLFRASIGWPSAARDSAA